MLLYVEDDEDDRILFRMAIVRNYGRVKYIEATNGVECLSTLESMTVLPKLIVTDINMPMMNGYELIRILRNTEKYADIPIVVLSTAPKEAEAMAIRMGANRFFSKPPEYVEFQRIVKSIITDYIPEKAQD